MFQRAKMAYKKGQGRREPGGYGNSMKAGLAGAQGKGLTVRGMSR